MYNKHMETDCIYCSHGYTLADGESTACEKYGMVCRRFKCAKFKYTPLKRKPSGSAKSVDFDENDFKL